MSGMYFTPQICVHELSDGYVNWFHSYLTNCLSSVSFLHTFPLPFQVLLVIPQESLIGPLLFNLFTNDLCIVLKYCKYLLFADDIKIFHVVHSTDDGTLLQSDIELIQGWCMAHFMKLNISKTKVTAFNKKNKYSLLCL
jgi:hypothetical protein